jgi:hypothetical protein
MKWMNLTLKYGEHIDIDVSDLLKFECQHALYGQVIIEFHLLPFCVFKGHTRNCEDYF